MSEKKKFGRGHKLTPEEKEESIKKRKEYMKNYHHVHRDKLLACKRQATRKYFKNLLIMGRKYRDIVKNSGNTTTEIVFIE